MSWFSKTPIIPVSQCLRAMMKHVYDTEGAYELMGKHPWCARYCQTKCIASSQEVCRNQSVEFCSRHCKSNCFHTGSITPEWREWTAPFIYPDHITKKVTYNIPSMVPKMTRATIPFFVFHQTPLSIFQKDL